MPIMAVLIIAIQLKAQIPDSLGLKSLNCSHCLCQKDISPLSTMISHVHPKGKWMFAYRAMTMHMEGNYLQGKRISETKLFDNYLMGAEHMNMQMHMIMIMVGLSDKFTIMSMLNFNYSNMSMIMPENESGHTHNNDESHSHNHHMKSTGLGDTKIYALYSLINNSRHDLIGSLGLSIPSGSIKKEGHKSLYPLRMPYMMQLGSGSFEVLPSLSYLYKINKWNLGAQINYIIRANDNVLTYRLGNELSVNSWAAYLITDWLSTSIKAEYLYIGTIKGKDNSLFELAEPAANSKNYGGNLLNIHYGVNFFIKQHRLSIELAIPITQHWQGIQMHRKLFGYFGWQIMF
ncbi:MAG: transporter [Cytophagales bacterium]|nr:MAG: transporter [Cytophagales bacterium]